MNQNLTSYFFSMEMGAQSILQRLLMLSLNTTANKIEDDLKAERGHEYSEEIMRLNRYVKINDQKGLRTRDIERAIRNNPADFYFIDHHLKVTADGTQFEKVTQVTGDLFRIVGETNTRIVLIVQENRHGTDGEIPPISGGKGGGSTEEDPDLIIGMCCPERGKSCVDTRKGTIEMAVLGNRFGTSPNHRMRFNYSSETSLLTEVNSGL